MKRITKSLICLVMLGMVITVISSQAQQRSWRSQTPLVLCDVLMLDQEKSEKVVAVYGEVRQKLRDEWQNSGTDFRSMGDDERQKFFSKYQKDSAAGLKKGLKDVLSEKELVVVDAILAKRISMPDTELRALRLIELKEGQRKKIQPLAVALGKKMVPSSSRFFGSQMSDEEREKAEKAFQKEKTAFLPKVAGILSEDQNKAWKEKTEEVNKEIEEIRERRRSYQNR